MKLDEKQHALLKRCLHDGRWRTNRKLLGVVVYLLLLENYEVGVDISSAQISTTLKEHGIAPTVGGFYPDLRALIEAMPGGMTITRTVLPTLFYVQLNEMALPQGEGEAQAQAGSSPAPAEGQAVRLEDADAKTNAEPRPDPARRHLLELLWANCAPGTEQNAGIVTRLLMTHGFHPEDYGTTPDGLLTALGFSTRTAAGIRLVTIPPRPAEEPQEVPKAVEKENAALKPVEPKAPAEQKSAEHAGTVHSDAGTRPSKPVEKAPAPLKDAAHGRRAFDEKEQSRVLALLRQEYAPGSRIPMAQAFHFLDVNNCAANRYELNGIPLRGKMILEILGIPTQRNEQGGWLVCMPEEPQKGAKSVKFADNLSNNDEISFETAAEPAHKESYPVEKHTPEQPENRPPKNCQSEVFFPYANQDRLAEQLGVPTPLNASLLDAVCTAYDAAYAAGQVTWNDQRGCFNAVLPLANTSGTPILLGISRSDQKGGLPFYLSFVGTAPKAARLTALQEFAWLGNYHAFLQQLADLAEPEMWSFQGRDDLSILNNYITYTFARLKQQDKVYIDPAGRFAAFNTGLMSRIYGEDLMAYFVPNNVPDRQKWRFSTFCSTLDEARNDAAQRSAAIALAPVRSKLSLATYFTDVCFETRFDPGCELDYQFFHIVGDNIGRFPLEFLRRHCNDFPRSRALLAQAEAESDPNRRQHIFKELGRAVTDLDDADMSALFYDLRIQFEAAVNRTLELARRDYKVGVPCFFPTTGKLSMLLPISFSARRNAKPCLALVAERLDNGMYVGRTVLTMDMAYKDSRLLCRPSGEWLRPAEIQSSDDEEE